MNLPKEALDFGTRTRGGGQTGEQLARLIGGVGFATGSRIGDRQVEPRFMKIGVDLEGRFERLNGGWQITFRALKNADVRNYDGVVRFEPPRFGQRTLGAGKVAGATAARRQPDERVGRRQPGRYRGCELRFAALAVARL